METNKRLVRFDWAIKHLLRHKANFDVLEGFLCVLLGKDLRIKQILESESNKEEEKEKLNRVDILVEDEKGELIIIEIQNTQEYDYFQRMLFGASKAITEHIKEGSAYSSVKKIISITIAYFDLGQGKDYVYHGTTSFKGIHKGDVLGLSERQIEVCGKLQVHEIFPEYYIIKIGKFRNKIKDELDEWIYFLKNSEIKSTFSAKGLKEAGQKLDALKLPETERKSYNGYLRYLMDVASRNLTIEIDYNARLKKETEELNKLAEEYKKAADESKKAADESKKAADENKKAADENKKAADESKKEADESKKEADESKKEADESKKEADKLRVLAIEKEEKIVLGLVENGLSNDAIASILGISIDKITTIVNKNNFKNFDNNNA